MEDKRIIKTKKNLKNTMIELLRTVPFEKITVSEICRVAQTSRITFYTYYEDKYALTEEMFTDYTNEAIADYTRLQSENNCPKNAMQGYYNMLECIINLYYNNIEFFSHAQPEKNPYLYTSFSRHVFSNVENYIELHKKQMPPKYSSLQTAALLCHGIWGVINEAYRHVKSKEELQSSVMGMYGDILRSDIFLKPNK